MPSFQLKQTLLSYVAILFQLVIDYKLLYFVLGLPQCWIDLKPWQWRVYMTTVAVALFFIPAVIISGCYAVIVWTIWSKSKLLMPVGHMPIRNCK